MKIKDIMTSEGKNRSLDILESEMSSLFKRGRQSMNSGVLYV